LSSILPLRHFRSHTILRREGQKDFIIRLKNAQATHLILETKGYDPLEQVKANAANRWVDAGNASGQYGHWACVICRKPTDVGKIIENEFNPGVKP